VSEDEHEPSYYEIALTGKQVTGAFVVVLVSLLVAFFSGVWIGRGAPREALADPDSVAAATTPAAGNELSFFADRPAEPPPVTKPAPAPVTPPPVPIPEPELAPPATAEPVVEEPVPTPARVESKPEPKPEPKLEVKPEGAKPNPPAATPAPTGPLVIQVFTSSDEAKARDMLKKLKAKNFKAYLSPTKANSKTVYRVRVGPFAKEADAKATSDKIEKQFKVDTWITRSP
jgi:DedD protein